MSETTKNTNLPFYSYTAISTGIAAAASYLTAPSIAATSFMQTAFGFSTIALQIASFSIAPAFIALATYSFYNIAKNVDLNFNFNSNIGSTPKTDSSASSADPKLLPPRSESPQHTAVTIPPENQGNEDREEAKTTSIPLAVTNMGFSEANFRASVLNKEKKEFAAIVNTFKKNTLK